MDGLRHGTVVARVVSVAPHPNGDEIFLAHVDLGDGQAYQIVFGGRRMLEEGDLVPAAPPGARLPNGAKMRRRRFRGELSHGMLCSANELGWSTSGRDEVAVLRQEIAEPGKSLDDIDFPEDWLVDPSVLISEAPPAELYPSDVSPLL